MTHLIDEDVQCTKSKLHGMTVCRWQHPMLTCSICRALEMRLLSTAAPLTCSIAACVKADRVLWLDCTTTSAPVANAVCTLTSPVSSQL